MFFLSITKKIQGKSFFFLKNGNFKKFSKLSEVMNKKINEQKDSKKIDYGKFQTS